jgi:P27 family predicted phage terminase small subunit
MGARGPAPRPREQQLDLEVRKDRVPAPVNVGSKLTQAKPPVKLPAGIAKVWRELAPMLLDAGMLAESDLQTLEALATFIYRARQARAEMEGQPLTVYGVKGGLIANPLLRIERDAWAQAHKLAVEFGMTPSARARLGVTLLTGRGLQHELAGRLGAIADDAPKTITIELEED